MINEKSGHKFGTDHSLYIQRTLEQEQAVIRERMDILWGSFTNDTDVSFELIFAHNVHFLGNFSTSVYFSFAIFN